MTTVSMRARSGAAWAGLSAVAVRLTTFATGIVVARLVAPEQVGVFVVALTVQAIVISASELGMGSAIARMAEGVERAAPTAVTLALASSAALTGVLVAGAPVIAGWFGVPEAAWPLRVMALTVLCAGVSTVSNGLLLREFAGRRRFAAEAGNTAVSSVVLIVLILAGWGAMALAVGRLAGQLTSTVLLLRLAPRLYRPGFDRREARRLISFGLPLVGASTLGFATVNLDNIAVGRIAGPAQLGPYSLAFNVASWPFTVFTSMINTVALPAFAQADGIALQHRVRRTLQAVAAVAVPSGALLAALASPVVLALYGSAWEAAIAPLAVLAALGIVRAPLDVLGNLIVSRGHTRLFLLVQVAVFIACAVAIPLGVVNHGAVGAAWGLGAVTVLVVAPLTLAVCATVLRTPLRLVSSAVAPAFLTAPLVAAVAWWTADRAANLGPWLALALGATSGGAVYVLLAHRWLYRIAQDLGVGALVARLGRSRA